MLTWLTACGESTWDRARRGIGSVGSGDAAIRQSVNYASWLRIRYWRQHSGNRCDSDPGECAAGRTRARRDGPALEASESWISGQWTNSHAVVWSILPRIGDAETSLDIIEDLSRYPSTNALSTKKTERNKSAFPIRVDNLQLILNEFLKTSPTKSQAKKEDEDVQLPHYLSFGPAPIIRWTWASACQPLELTRNHGSTTDTTHQ